MAPTIEQIARTFHCTPEQVRAQFRRNAAELLTMAEKAELKKGKVNGFTEQQLRSAAAEMGAKGGTATSEAKRAASRANGRKGGRPKKATNN